MKFNKTKIVISIILIIISFLVGFYFYPLLPSTLATHWGINGEANGFSSKSFALFFMPVLSVFILALFSFLPKTDPYKKNFNQFSQYYENFIVVIISFFFYLYLVTIAWNLGYRFNMIQVLSPAFAGLFYFISILTANAKRNWFVGIRTPWTLSSEDVWDKTHKLGARLFKIVAFISLLSLILPQYALIFIVAPLILASVSLFVYSYIIYRGHN